MTFVLIVTLLISMKVIEGNIVNLFEGPTTSTFYVGDIRFGLTDNQRAINRVIAVGSSVVDVEEANLAANYELMVKAHEVLEGTLLSEENKVILEQIWEALEQEEVYRTELIALMDAGDFEGVNNYDEDYYTPLVEEMRALADQLDQGIFAVGEEYCSSSAAASEESSAVAVSFAAGAFLWNLSFAV